LISNPLPSVLISKVVSVVAKLFDPEAISHNSIFVLMILAEKLSI
jgi:hypothetical protein